MYGLVTTKRHLDTWHIAVKKNGWFHRPTWKPNVFITLDATWGYYPILPRGSRPPHNHIQKSHRSLPLEQYCIPFHESPSHHPEDTTNPVETVKVEALSLLLSLCNPLLRRLEKRNSGCWKHPRNIKQIEHITEAKWINIVFAIRELSLTCDEFRMLRHPLRSHKNYDRAATSTRMSPTSLVLSTLQRPKTNRA